MKTMIIEWQRLVNDEGQTCDRCADTGESAEVAFEKLKRCLVEVGIKVIFEKRSLAQSTFSANPIDSNQIKIDGKLLEQLLDGSTGHSQCCGPCGDSECRTLTVDGITYEAIPEELIISAGLLAAAEKLRLRSITAKDTCCGPQREIR